MPRYPDRDIAAVRSALVALDPCRLIDPATVAVPELPPPSPALPETTPHTCRISFGDPLSGQDVTVSVGVEFGHPARYGAAPELLAGAKTYLGRFDAPSCFLAVPVSHTYAIQLLGFGSTCIAARPDHSLQLQFGFYGASPVDAYRNGLPGEQDVTVAGHPGFVLHDENLDLAPTLSRDWTIAAGDRTTAPGAVSLAVELGLPRGAPVFDVDPGLVDRSGLDLAEQVLADIIRTQFG